ncbi:hypothetical protein E6C76_13990 [Pseudothauera nasutitermitis]|uniref:Uncharacterized protein n=1 Tax=Pseudothauera nasutitermitis TaxID=2565930 RepID=A0A4S4AWP6_9RHOO|nr:hypothetical protein [Pseudothauera nasutitermitis]THF63695.1 hypothetical protein E6C76_13990 [Pseudothauera nasutitermitis]
MMVLRQLAKRNKHVANAFSPIATTTIQKRKHHFMVTTDAIGNQSLAHMGPHTANEAAILGVTKQFANRHVAEIHGNNGAVLSPNLMADLARRMSVLRSQGAGIGKPETPPKNTTIAIDAGLSTFPESKGAVKLNLPGVLGIATKTKGQLSPVINTGAVVTRNKQGIVNHLDSSS